MFVSWRWCCHCFYGKFWRHDVRQQDLNSTPTRLVSVGACTPMLRCYKEGNCRAGAMAAGPDWRRGHAAKTFCREDLWLQIYFLPLCVFLGRRSNNVKLTSTMLRLLYQQSCLYEVVNTSTTDRVDWNEFEQTNVPGEGLVSWWSW